MRVIPPVEITTAKLISSSCYEDPTSLGLFSIGTTYAITNVVKVLGLSGAVEVYKSLQNSNLGHDPSATANPEYVATTAYTATQQVSSQGITYECLVGNTGQYPALSPTYWKPWWQHQNNTYLLWLVGTPYLVGDKVIRTETHKVYECLIANTGNIPENNLIGTTPKWLEIESDNRWAMFDLSRSTTTNAVSPLTTVIAPGRRIDSCAVINTNATYVTISVQAVVSGTLTTVYTNVKTMPTRPTRTWYEYFFGPFVSDPSMVKFDLPPYANGTITITQSRTQGKISCGAVVVGMYKQLGFTQQQPSSEALNFSSVDRDIYGNASMIKRRTVPKTNQVCWAYNTDLNAIRQVRDDLNAVAAVWSGLDNDEDGDYFETLLILGFYRTFTMNMETPLNAMIQLELEEI